MPSPEARARALASLALISDAEEARINAGIAADPDNPEWTEAEFAKARQAGPDLIEAARNKVGRPRLDRPKRQVTLRLSAEVLDGFRASGPGWQSRIDAVLLAYLANSGR